MIEITRMVLSSKKHVYASSSNPPYPKINMALVIASDFAVHMFCEDVEMNIKGNNKIPRHVTD